MDREHAGENVLFAGRQRAHDVQDQLPGEIVQMVSRLPVVERSHGRVATVDQLRTRGQRILQLGKSPPSHPGIFVYLYPRYLYPGRTRDTNVGLSIEENTVVDKKNGTKLNGDAQRIRQTISFSRQDRR